MPAPGESGAESARRSATVRQAVALPHVGGDPGAALVPGSAEALEAAEVEAWVRRPEPGSPAPVGVQVGALVAAEVSAPVEAQASPPVEPPAIRIPEAAPQLRVPTVATQSQEAPVAASVAAAAVAVQPPAVQAVGVNAEPPERPDTAQHFTSPNRPKKQMLAAAAIVGSLLVAVPFVVLALNSGDDKQQTDSAALAAQDRTVLGDDDAAASPPGAFTPASPTHKQSAAPPSTPAKHKPTTAAPARTTSAAAPHTNAAVPKSTSKGTTGTAAKAATPAKTAAPAATATQKAQSASTTFSGINNVLLKNTSTGHCVDIPNYGKGTLNGPVREYYCEPGSGDNQMWNLDVTQKGAGPGGANLFLIRNVKDGYCMDLPNYGSNAATTKVTEYHCDGSFNDNQLWWLDKRPNGSYWIRNYSSNQLCLDVTGHRDPAIDLNLTIFSCSDSDDQNWTFTS